MPPPKFTRPSKLIINCQTVEFKTAHSLVGAALSDPISYKTLLATATPLRKSARSGVYHFHGRDTIATQK